MILSEMSLEEEVGWPAFFEYLLSRNAWPDERYYSFAKRSNVGGQVPCMHKSNSDRLNIDDTVCGRWTNTVTAPPGTAPLVMMAAELIPSTISLTAPLTGTRACQDRAGRHRAAS